ncbi:hypothetical protein ACMFMG_007790 [Clarireedia jacksonii]
MPLQYLPFIPSYPYFFCYYEALFNYSSKYTGSTYYSSRRRLRGEVHSLSVFISPHKIQYLMIIIKPSPSLNSGTIKEYPRTQIFDQCPAAKNFGNIKFPEQRNCAIPEIPMPLM